jgi:hypothetical protein
MAAARAARQGLDAAGRDRERSGHRERRQVPGADLGPGEGFQEPSDFRQPQLARMALAVEENEAPAPDAEAVHAFCRVAALPCYLAQQVNRRGGGAVGDGSEPTVAITIMPGLHNGAPKCTLDADFRKGEID